MDYFMPLIYSHYKMTQGWRNIICEVKRCWDVALKDELEELA